jgi:hypothetical protein
LTKRKDDELNTDGDVRSIQTTAGATTPLNALRREGVAQTDPELDCQRI